MWFKKKKPQERFHILFMDADGEIALHPAHTYILAFIQNYLSHRELLWGTFHNPDKITLLVIRLRIVQIRFPDHLQSITNPGL